MLSERNNSWRLLYNAAFAPGPMTVLSWNNKSCRIIHQFFFLKRRFTQLPYANVGALVSTDVCHANTQSRFCQSSQHLANMLTIQLHTQDVILICATWRHWLSRNKAIILQIIVVFFNRRIDSLQMQKPSRSLPITGTPSKCNLLLYIFLLVSGLVNTSKFFCECSPLPSGFSKITQNHAQTLKLFFFFHKCAAPSDRVCDVCYWKFMH